MIAVFFWPAFYADNDARGTTINTNAQRHVADIGTDKFVTSDHRISETSCTSVWIASESEAQVGVCR